MKTLLLLLTATTCFGQLVRPRTEIFVVGTNTFITVPTNKVIRITATGGISSWYVDEHPVERPALGSCSVIAGPARHYFDGGMLNYEIVPSKAKTLWLSRDLRTITVPRGKCLRVLDAQYLIDVTVQRDSTEAQPVLEDFYSRNTKWVGPLTIQISGWPLDPGNATQGYVTYVIVPAVSRARD